MESEDLKSGILFKKEKEKLAKVTKWKEYFFVLHGGMLYWFKDDKEAKKTQRNPTKAKRWAPLLGATISAHVKLEPGEQRDHAFQITTPKEQLILATTSEEAMNDWVDVLKTAASGATAGVNRETINIQEELRKSGHDIPAQDLDFDDESVIGSGASGVVKRGMWLKSTEVAVKALKNLPEFTDTKELVSFYKEIETLSKLRHVNIVQMYGFCKKNNYVCLVTEFVKGGNLASCLQDKQKYPLDFSLQLELALNITRGMVYLHNQNVVHRDLKPANILIESWEEGKVKVCDFGLSKVVRKGASKEKDAEALGSPQYAAPELSREDHNNRVDVFSFGVILWEIFTRDQPWPEIRFGWEFAERYQAGKRPPIPVGCPFGSLISRCWAQDPADRPSFVQVYEELEAIRKSDAALLRKPAKSPVQRSLTAASGLPVMRNTTLTSLPSAQHQSSSPNLTPTQSSAQLEVQVPVELKPLNAIEYQINLIFNNPEQKETWPVFAAAFAKAMGTTMDTMAQLRYLFDEGGNVTRANYERFLLWFQPLSVPDLYQTSDNGCTGGYEIDVIVDLSSAVWFHGFLASPDAQKILKGQENGTYLFRFSTTNPGYYALSVAYSGTVGHWRIAVIKEHGQPPRFKIDGREYRSLQNIIETHKFGRESLKIKSPKAGQSSSCYLGQPLRREAAKSEDYYQTDA